MIFELIPPSSSLPPGSKVWAYLRGSEGNAQKQNISQQRAEIDAYCKKYSLILERVFADVAKSGSNAAKRERFLEMVNLSEKEELRPDGILVWNFARFSRNMDEASYYKGKLRMFGIVIHSLTDQIPDTPEGRMKVHYV